jgi:hypothetical protein
MLRLTSKRGFWDRLFSGELLGLSLRPDITNNQLDKFVDDAEWAVHDSWVDVGHALSLAVRKHAASQGSINQTAHASTIVPGATMFTSEFVGISTAIETQRRKLLPGGRGELTDEDIAIIKSNRMSRKELCELSKKVLEGGRP